MCRPRPFRDRLLCDSRTHHRRRAAQGINVGALLAPLVCGGLQRAFGYDYGFGAAGVGMLIALAMMAGMSTLVVMKQSMKQPTISSPPIS